MKWLNLLIKKIVKKKTSLVITLSLALALILSVIISGCNAADSFQRAYEQRLDNIYGSQHAVFFKMFFPDQKIESPLIDSVGYFDVFGKAESELSISDIVLGSADAAMLDIHHIKLLDGRMPQSENEAVVEKWMLNKSGLDIKLGEEIQMTFNALDDEEHFTQEKTITFKVVGVVSDYSVLHMGENVYYENALFPSIIFSSSPYENAIKSCSVILHNPPADYRKTIAHIAEYIVFPAETMLNVNRYDSNGAMGSATVFVKTTVDSLYTLIILVSVVLIFLLQYLFVHSQRKIVNASASIGATGAQIGIFIFCICIMLSLFALIPGILSGLLLSGLFEHLLFNVFEVEFAPGIDFKSILTSCAVFIATNLCAALFCIVVAIKGKHSKVREKTPVKVSKLKSPYMLLAYKSILCNPKCFLAIATAITVCMLAAAIGAEYKNESKGAQIIDKDYDFAILTKYFDYTYAGIARPNEGLDELTDSFREICRNTVIKNYTLRYMSRVYMLADNDDKLRNDVFSSYFEDVTDTVNYVLDAYDHNKENAYGVQTLVCTDNSSIEKMKSFNVIGEINTDALKSGKEVIMCFHEKWLDPEKAGDEGIFKTYYEGMKSLIGSEIRISQITGYKDMYNPGRRVDYPVTLGAIVIIPETADEWSQKMLSSKSSLVSAYDFWEKSDLVFSITDCYIELDDPEALDAFEGRVKKTLNKISYDNWSIDCSATYRNEAKKTFIMLDAVIGGISIALLGFAVLFMIINYTENAVSKKELFVQLYTIGATPEQINIIMLLEYITCVVLALIFAAIPIGVLALYCMAMGIEGGAAATILSGLIAPAIIILLLCLPIYFVNKKWLKNILA